jgi:uncharacterized protein YqjF (DUF2071 family)
MLARVANRFLTARWSYLLMLNFEVDPALLKPFLPNGTDIDLWEETAYLSIVGFQFLDTRVKGIPVPFHRNFEEVNLRFYVRRHVRDESRRGVVFIREFVPRWATAFVARQAYEESYTSAPMRHTLSLPGASTPGSVSYRWCYPTGWNSISAEFAGAPADAAPGSHEEFITEHYWGYCAKRAGTLEYRVEHPRWRVWRATSPSLHADAAALYGPAFVEPLSRPPASALLAEGSPVAVRRGVPLGSSAA